MDVAVTWNNEVLQFTGEGNSGFQIDLDASARVGGTENGFRPTELLALGLAGCTAIDVLIILKKKRQQVTDFHVNVHTEVANQHPQVWTQVNVEYVVTGRDIDPKAIERAMKLSYDKYCPAQNMINKAVDIEQSYKIIEAEPA